LTTQSPIHILIALIESAPNPDYELLKRQGFYYCRIKGNKMDILSKFRLDEKVAIVTGSGHGIGKAIALGFAQVGAHVVVASRSQNNADATAQEVRALGRRSISLVVDVTKSADVNKTIEATLKEFGRIDILVNNVGRGGEIMLPCLQMREEDWDSYYRINMMSTFLCSKAVSRTMIDQKSGNIINIASAAGTRPDPGRTPYAASKAAQLSFTTSLSIELAPYHIRVNSIIPGAINTMPNSSRGSGPERAARAGIPLGRIGEPEDVALAAIFLASDASDYVTGTHIEVKGGPYTRKGDAELFFSRFPQF
jgi:3-oxoacyl-[acyl-carrier protein] reductase